MRNLHLKVPIPDPPTEGFILWGVSKFYLPGRAGANLRIKWIELPMHRSQP